jgi:hypothetical protein
VEKMRLVLRILTLKSLYVVKVEADLANYVFFLRSDFLQNKLRGKSLHEVFFENTFNISWVGWGGVLKEVELCD